MAASDFRIILVGGGPVGLVAAHIFAAAGIDFVLLEQRPTIVPQQGAGIVLFPHTQRVFEQLGLMEPIRKIAYRFNENRIVDRWGWHYNTTYSHEWSKENHGAGWLFLHRPELLQALYDALPDRVKSRVLVAKKVDSIAVHTDGVSVKCIDGTTERGSIVVGADGVHSRVRACLCKLESEAGIGPADDEFVSTYRCMYGSVGKIPGLEIGPEWDLHGSGVAMQLFGTAEKSWFLFYDKLLQSTQERTTYSEEDMERVALQFADVYVTDKVRFKDVWRVRDWVMLADLPEGIRTRWSGDRIVLVGDAASKQTPNIGQGWNCGVQDVVVLTNQLQSLLQSKSTSIISPNDLKTVFERYRGTRLPDLEACVKAAAGATRAVAWDTWSAWLQDRFITPWTDGSKQAFRQAFGAIVSKGRILEFVPERNRIAGVVPWEYASKSKD